MTIFPNHSELTEERKRLVQYMDKAMRRWRQGNPIPYLWGGQSWSKYKSKHHPGYYKNIQGVDCSGFVILGLIDVGILKVGYDTTAAGLRSRFQIVSSAEALPGDLVFFGSGKRISHVGMCYQPVGNGHWVMVEAGGGGSTCKTVEIAMSKNAYVRPAWTSRRSDIRGYGRIL